MVKRRVAFTLFLFSSPLFADYTCQQISSLNEGVSAFISDESGHVVAKLQNGRCWADANEKNPTTQLRGHKVFWQQPVQYSATNRGSNLAVTDLTTRGTVVLIDTTKNPQGSGVYNFSVSPSGKWVVAASPQLMLVNVENGEQKPIFETSEMVSSRMHGWSKNEDSFWFSLESPLTRSYVLANGNRVHPVDLHYWESMDAANDYVFWPERGWVVWSSSSQVNGGPLILTDAISGKTVTIDKSSAPMSFQPRWDKKQGLLYQSSTGKKILGEKKIMELFAKAPRNEGAEADQAVTLYPFPDADYSILVDDQYYWIDNPPGRTIHRVDLRRGKIEAVSEGMTFWISAGGQYLVIDRYSELVLKNLTKGKEVVIYPPEKIGQTATDHWPKDKNARGFTAYGWTRTEKRFWFSKDDVDGDAGPLCAMIDQKRIVTTNVIPGETPERIFNYEMGWMVETQYPSGKPAVLTLTSILSGQTINVAQSNDKQFHPKFRNDLPEFVFEYVVNGDTVTVPYAELKNRLDTADQTKKTSVGNYFIE